MLRNYITIAFRNIQRKKVYALINLFGLSTGIAFIILILLFIYDEFSFDSFHSNKDRIYRVYQVDYKEGQPVQESKQLILPLPFANTFQEEIPGVTHTTTYTSDFPLISHQDRTHQEMVTYVKKDFTDMFTLNYVTGQTSDPLGEVKNILISTSIAKKYFGDQNPVGKSLSLKRGSTEEAYTVAAVFEDFPVNSSLDAKIFLRLENHHAYAHQQDDWNASYTPVFIMLAPHADIKSVKERSEAFIQKYFGWRANMTGDKKGSTAQKFMDLSFTSLNDIHFDNTVNWYKASNIQYSYILGGMGLLILLVACINYVLLSLTSSASRTKEVGIRKVLGASKGIIRWQFWGEAQLFTLMALVSGMTLAQVCLPAFNRFTNKNLDFSLVQHPEILVSMLILTLLTGFLAGGYPATVLSQYIPSKVLKDRSSQRYRSGFARYLIVFQLVVCVFCISCALIMYQQLKYISEKDLGFNQEQIVVVPLHNTQQIPARTIIERFRHELTHDQRISDITAMSALFGQHSGSSGRTYNGKLLTIQHIAVDYNFFQTLQMEIVEGKGFAETMKQDTLQEVVINQTLADRLAYDKLIGNHLPNQPDTQIIGVVKDFNFFSLEHAIEPMSFQLSDRCFNLLVKVVPGQIPAALQTLENTWKENVSDDPLSFSFLDDALAAQYDTYQRWLDIVTASTLLGILIACLGLFGLTGINAVNRTKEIGIRKVLGANVLQIVFLLNRQVLILSVLAALVAIPLSHFAMSQWLENFVYRITLEWDLFVYAIITGLVLVVCTVSYHTLKAATANPTEALQYE